MTEAILEGITMLDKLLVIFLLVFAHPIVHSIAQAQEQALAPQEISVRNAVLAFYQMSKGGRNREMEASLISEELHALLQLAKAMEGRSAREIKVSDHPTDKPLLLEGALFTPDYEGFSRLVSIENIRQEKGAYLADVKLIYDHATPPYAWTDTAVIILEDERWKVDDVLFHDSTSSETNSVKQNLRNFAGICQRQR
jgi:hypothetical protein